MLLLASLAVTLAACGGAPLASTAAPTTVIGTTVPPTQPASATAPPATPNPASVAATPPAGPATATPTFTPRATSTAGTGNVALGRQIFQQGIGPQGQPIPRTGGTVGGMMVGGMMAGAGCAACHGPQGQGLTTPALTTPNITYRNLTDPNGMLEPDGSRGPTYTDATLARAITTGIDAEGQPLDQTMPRWQLTDQEMQDLLAYLETLP